ncbi:MAG TPA: extracellular solute-binding protein [Firmicutes bacterium]|nr:extracellular solute-binding protein [Bacillota bacterium]
MKRRFNQLFATILTLALVVGVGAMVHAQEQVVTIRAWTVGPDTPAYYRAENLQLAAERLNRILADAGASVRVDVDVDFWTESWDSYRRRVILAFESGDPDAVPDIINSSHLDIPVWAEAGWLAPMDEYIERYWDMVYQDFFPHLWDSVTLDGKRYGVPQDIEVRMVFYRKDHLAALGWTQEEIEDLPRRIRDKEFLLDDLIDVARQMQEAGLVEWGILHRPTAGPDFFQFIAAYGGEYFDPETGKLVLDREAVLRTLEFFQRLVEEGITPRGMTSWPWPSVHRAIAIDGSAGIQITGGMWNWREWQRDFSQPEEDLFADIGFALIPAGNAAGRPNQLGQPQAYMITSASKNKDLAGLLITLASAVDLNTNHAIEGAKLAIRQSQTAFAPFAEAEFLSQAAALLPQQIFLPVHPGSGFYSTALYEAISGVEAGMLTPEVALQQLEQRLKAQLGDDLVVR